MTRDFAEPCGSARLYDNEHLVTNNHVIEDLLDPIEVRFPWCCRGGKKGVALVSSDKTIVPVWTLAIRDVPVPKLADDAMTPDRLSELTTVLAAMAGAPIATLEAHPMPEDLDATVVVLPAAAIA